MTTNIPDYCEDCQHPTEVVWHHPVYAAWLCLGCYMAACDDFERVSR